MPVEEVLAGLDRLAFLEVMREAELMSLAQSMTGRRSAWVLHPMVASFLGFWLVGPTRGLRWTTIATCQAVRVDTAHPYHRQWLVGRADGD